MERIAGQVELCLIRCEYSRQHLQCEKLSGSKARNGEQGSGPSSGDHRRLRLTRISCMSSQLTILSLSLSLCMLVSHSLLISSFLVGSTNKQTNNKELHRGSQIAALAFASRAASTASAHSRVRRQRRQIRRAARTFHASCERHIAGQRSLHIVLHRFAAQRNRQDRVRRLARHRILKLDRVALRRNDRSRSQSSQLHSLTAKSQSVLRDDGHRLVEGQHEVIGLFSEETLHWLGLNKRGHRDF